MSDPGLNVAALQALRRPTADLANLRTAIAAHLTEHRGYVAFSGGKDSTAVLHLARQVDPTVPVVFFDSGLEFPETYRYIADLTEQWQLNLHVIDSDPPLLQLLHDSGGWDHHAPDRVVPDLKRILIEIPAQTAHQHHGPGELWGVRSRESRGRARMYARAAEGRITRTDGTVAYGPIWNWSDEQVWTYLAHHKIPTNPVYDRLRALGAPARALRVSHLVDGQGLQLGRLTWLRRGWPALYQDLQSVLPRMDEYL